MALDLFVAAILFRAPKIAMGWQACLKGAGSLAIFCCCWLRAHHPWRPVCIMCALCGHAPGRQRKALIRLTVRYAVRMLHVFIIVFPAGVS